MSIESGLTEVYFAGPRLARVDALAREAMEGALAPGREPGYRYRHGRRVAELALRLAEEEEARVHPDWAALDRELLCAGALLHDVAREGVYAGERRDHAAAGEEWVRTHLTGLYPPPELDRIAAMVRWHNRRRERPLPLECRIVQDADLLDHFGVMEFWLAAYHAAAHGQTLEEALDWLAGPAAAGWRRYALDGANFRATVARLEERMALADHIAARARREARGELRG